MAAGEFGTDDVGVFAEGGDCVRVEVETGGDDGEVVDHDWNWARVRHLITARQTNFETDQKMSMDGRTHLPIKLHDRVLRQ